MPLHHQLYATNSQIVEWCCDPHRETIGGYRGATEVISVANFYAVKNGKVYDEEATNQRIAYEILDANTVRVPFVYHFFARDDTGYLVMELVHGTKRSSIEDGSAINAIAKAVVHTQSIHNCQPGPLGGGISRGLLWSDDVDATFSSREHLETYLNSRLHLSRLLPQISLSTTNLVMCHLDLAPRNILVLENGHICLLDWAFAGYYPAFFEKCALRLNHGAEGADIRYNRLLELENSSFESLE